MPRSESAQLLWMTAQVFLFFGLHNFLQEAINSRPGFTFAWALGLMEMIGTVVGSGIESALSGESLSARNALAKSGNRVDYAVVSCCLLSSSSLASICLNYISFPTKVKTTVMMNLF